MKRYSRKILTILLFLQTVLGAAADPEQSPGSAVRQKLLLTFTGDMMAHVINFQMNDYSLIYRDIESIMTGDSLTFSNVEFPVNPGIPQASYPVFNIHPEYVTAAIDAGVDVLSIANNHTADQGLGGLLATVGAMETITQVYEIEKGRMIYYSGAKTDPAEDFKPVTILTDGWKIGYLAVSQFSNHRIPAGYMHLSGFSDEDSDILADLVRKIRPDYDLLVIAYHGGEEYRTDPLPEKKELFRKLAEAGADIVWGHHPHVMQPVEVVNNGNGGLSVLMYSMGNFISGQGRIADPDLPEEEWSYTGDSALLQVELTWKDGPEITGVSAVPIANVMTATAM